MKPNATFETIQENVQKYVKYVRIFGFSKNYRNRTSFGRSLTEIQYGVRFLGKIQVMTD